MPILRFKRLGEWWAVLGRESRNRSLAGLGRAGWRLIFVGLKVFVFRFGRVSGREWRQRIRVCERKCPIYDPSLKRCRPYDGHWAGCGCYVPWLALVKEPYQGVSGGCWADINLPGNGKGAGWKENGLRSAPGSMR